MHMTYGNPSGPSTPVTEVAVPRQPTLAHTGASSADVMVGVALLLAGVGTLMTLTSKRLREAARRRHPSYGR